MKIKQRAFSIKLEFFKSIASCMDNSIEGPKDLTKYVNDDKAMIIACSSRFKQVDKKFVGVENKIFGFEDALKRIGEER